MKIIGSWMKNGIGLLKGLTIVLLVTVFFVFSVLVLWIAIDSILDGEPVNLFFRWIKDNVLSLETKTGTELFSLTSVQ